MSEYSEARARKIEDMFGAKGIVCVVKDPGVGNWGNQHQSIEFPDLGIVLHAFGTDDDGGWFGVEDMS